jgi:hypothetical protein
MNEYYIKIGDVGSNKKPYAASSNRVEKWWAEFKNTNGLDRYEVYICGGFAEIVFGVSELTTFDVDVIVVGDIKDDYEGLKYILDESIRIGLDNYLIMDTWYDEKLYDITNPKPGIMYRSYKSGGGTSNGGVISKWEIHNPEYTDAPYGLSKIIKTKAGGSMIKANRRLLSGDYVGILKNVKEAFNSSGELQGKRIPDIKNGEINSILN